MSNFKKFLIVQVTARALASKHGDLFHRILEKVKLADYAYGHHMEWLGMGCFSAVSTDADKRALGWVNVHLFSNERRIIAISERAMKKVETDYCVVINAKGQFDSVTENYIDRTFKKATAAKTAAISHDAIWADEGSLYCDPFR